MFIDSRCGLSPPVVWTTSTRDSNLRRGVMKFSDIVCFNNPSYRINVDWNYMPRLLGRYKTDYHLIYDPDFQRGYVWTETQQIKYIEYILSGGMSGKEIYFNCPGWNDRNNKESMILVDGKQRIEAVRNFMNNKIRIFNHYFTEYTDNMSLFTGGFLFNINDLENYNDVIKWYISMNSGGSIHTNEDIERALKCIK